MRARGTSRAGARGQEHAGSEDTAATLAVDPKLVRDPKGASPEIGRAILESMIDRTAEAVMKAAPRPVK